MPHFKNAQNELFWLDAGEDPAKWLPGCVEISDEEAESIRQAKYQQLINSPEWLANQPTKEQQIAQLQAQLDALKG